MKYSDNAADIAEKWDWVMIKIKTNRFSKIRRAVIDFFTGYEVI
jgi:hypothetical protein